MTYPEIERRRAKRYHWLVDIYCDGVEGVGIVQTANISPYGLYFNTSTVIPKGARLKLRLPVAPEAKEYLVLEAVVAYSQPKVGVGVEFINMDESKQKRLEEFIAENHQALALGEEW